MRSGTVLGERKLIALIMRFRGNKLISHSPQNLLFGISKTTLIQDVPIKLRLLHPVSLMADSNCTYHDPGVKRNYQQAIALVGPENSVRLII